MKTQNRLFRKQGGSALILVVVVTVLLAVVGVMFLMVSRASEMETGAVSQSKDLDSAVDTVVARINEVLVEDLFGLTRPTVNNSFELDDDIVDADVTMTVFDKLNIYADESSDYPTHYAPTTPTGTWTDPINPGLNTALNPAVPVATNDDVWMPGQMDDYWLASLEPVWFDMGPDGLTGTQATMSDDTYVWPHITDLWGTIQGRADSLYYQRFMSTEHIYYPQATPMIWIDPDDDTANATDPWYGWDNATKWARWEVSAENVHAKIIQPKDRMAAVAVDINRLGTFPNLWQNATTVNFFGARADADGDGVADSRWVQMPGLTSSRGEPVFAAVRIIDNCAMLNLNAAHCFYQDSYATATNVSPFMTPWYATEPDMVAGTPYHDNQTGTGRYLTEINYMPFLRGHDLNGNFFDGGTGGDDWYNLMIAKGFNTWSAGVPIPFTPMQCQNILMSIENSGYQFFDISDELEIRNRYLLTSNAESRFEQEGVAHFSLDADAGAYAALETPRDVSNFNVWKYRIDPAQFEKWDMAGSPRLNADPLFPYFYRYDRRHVCTFYSYDRNLRKGQYPLLDSEILAYLATNPPLPANFSSMQEYEEYLWKVFTPKGAVTTNIENPNAAQPYNNLETRRRILHLLYALREHYLPANYFTLTPVQQATEKNTAALKAVQVIANIVDFSDNDSANDDNTGDADGLVDTQGPFYDLLFNVTGINIDYGQQANVDCAFITKDIIDGMITEVSAAILGTPITFDFGLPVTDIIFGYERQPFISEVAADWNGSPANPGDPYLEAFGLELVNPYLDMIDIKDWQIKIGTNSGSVLSSFNSAQGDVQWQIPGATDPNFAYAVLHRTQQDLGSINYAPGGVLITDPITDFDAIYGIWSGGQSLEIQLLRPAPQWVSDNLGIDYIVVDKIENDDVRSVLGTDGIFSSQKGHQNWSFIYDIYASVKTVATSPYVLGEKNTETVSASDSFQIGVADNGRPLARWHELEVLGLYGNGPESSDPNLIIQTVSSELVNLEPNSVPHFDLTGASSDLLDYICTINRPDLGSLPGRININTAPVHVIAAAIPPVLADPGIITAAPSGYSSLNLAQDIVANRPYASLGDLIAKVPRMKQYDTGAWATENVGMQSIQDDIEEEHWILSNLANKFTVRSDVFTAYILVRLGTDGPQRRMIGIFDRSQVWNKNDRPKLVALHPMPDPR